jgi:hypothetical protein
VIPDQNWISGKEGKKNWECKMYREPAFPEIICRWRGVTAENLGSVKGKELEKLHFGR